MSEGKMLRPAYDYKVTHYSIINGSVVYQIAFSNPRRKKLLFANGGSYDAKASPNNTVTLSQGLPLIKDVGSIEVDVKEDQNLPTLDWFIMAEGATSIYVLEIFEV